MNTERIEAIERDRLVAPCGAGAKCIGLDYYEEDDTYLIVVMAPSEVSVRLAAVTAHMSMQDIIGHGQRKLHATDEVRVTSTGEDMFFAGVVLNGDGAVIYFI